METKFRKCYVLREVQIDMDSLKKGDMFRLDKASPTDVVNDVQWSLANEDAKMCEPNGNAIVQATLIAFVAQSIIKFKSALGVKCTSEPTPLEDDDEDDDDEDYDDDDDDDDEEVKYTFLEDEKYTTSQRKRLVGYKRAKAQAFLENKLGWEFKSEDWSNSGSGQPETVIYDDTNIKVMGGHGQGDEFELVDEETVDLILAIETTLLRKDKDRGVKSTHYAVKRKKRSKRTSGTLIKGA